MPTPPWAWCPSKSAAAPPMAMQSSLNWGHAMSGDRFKRLVSGRFSWLSRTAAMFLFALAALLLWRRTAGAIRQPLSLWGIVAAGMILSLVAKIAHEVSGCYPAKRNAALFRELSLSAALFAVAAALTVPGTSAVGLALFWTMLVLEEGGTWRTSRFVSLGDRRRRIEFQETEAAETPLKNLSFHPAHCAPREPCAREIVKPFFASAETIPPEEVTQQFTRSTAADGAEDLAGWLRVQFAASQRTLSVHLAFCPPFPHTPELSVEQIDGPAVRIKPRRCYPIARGWI